VRIHRIELASADVTAQAAFWREALGLPVEAGEDSVSVRLRRSTIAFVPATPGNGPRYHFAINVPGRRTKEALAWLRERVEVLPFENGFVMRFEWIGTDSLYFLDASGNVVELMVRDEISDRDEHPFGPDHLLEVGEIGIASDDVPATSEALRRALGAPTYWGGGDGLTAIGDATGAVLVSPRGRGWIPTGLPAEPAPATIVADGGPPGRTEIPGGPYVVEALA
jgi:catechol 2,3-dioxygenase-like lactoylglutathione lyase family enzyme